MRGLTKVYAGRNVVDGVEFDLQPGTVTAVLGRAEAGKSTLLRLACGLLRPTEGEVQVHGRTFADWPSPAHVAGAVLDTSVTHPGRTGRIELSLAARAAGLAPQRVDEVVDMLGLSGFVDQRIGAYGPVLRVWLGLAHALLADPPLLLLDEPMSELRPEDVITLRSLLRTHADRGGTVLVASRDLSTVDQSVDRALVLHEGRIISDGPVSLLTKAGTCQVQSDDNKALTEALRRAGARIRPQEDGYLAVHLAADQVADLAHKAGLRITSLREGERTLDEVLANLTGAS